MNANRRLAAIYARVSSDKQKADQTIASQTAALKSYAAENEYEVASDWIFEDEGYSGNVLARPGLERLRDLAAEGLIERILIYSPDRLSRKYAFQVLLLEEFNHRGVEVIFIKSVQGDTPEEQLLLQFQGMIAEYERAQISERSRRGKLHRARNGFVSVLSAAPYGYGYVKRTEHSEAYYEIIESEEAVVREIFRRYTSESESINAIARYLNEQDIPTRSGTSHWQRSTLHSILSNPAYKGVACYGKRESCDRQKVTRSARQQGNYWPRSRSSQPRPKSDWIKIPVSAIVTEDTFERAQEQLLRNKQLAARNTKEPTLLQGLLVCGKCGYSLYRNGSQTAKGRHLYYRCPGRDRGRFLGRDRICDNPPVRAPDLDDLVWDEVLSLLRNPELIRAEIDQRLHKRLESNPVIQRKDTLQKELTRLRRQIDRLLDAYQEELIPLDELRQRIPTLQKRESALRRELEALESKKLTDQQVLELSTNIEDYLAQLRSTVESMNMADRQKVIRLVVKDIVVDPAKIKINHSIPTPSLNATKKLKNLAELPNSLLRTPSLGGGVHE